MTRIARDIGLFLPLITAASTGCQTARSPAEPPLATPAVSSRVDNDARTATAVPSAGRVPAGMEPILDRALNPADMSRAIAALAGKKIDYEVSGDRVLVRSTDKIEALSTLGYAGGGIWPAVL